MTGYKDTVYWWLRNIGSNDLAFTNAAVHKNMPAYVSWYGTIQAGGIDQERNGVRPAILINQKALQWLRNTNDNLFHGEYTERFADYSVVGKYKDDKKDGELRISDESHIEIQNYRDGMKHGEWRFFHHQPWATEGKLAEILYKTETDRKSVV